jgi:23S rRNA (cytidine1920-2'-O)/16S rRNA (cytidine1409-2'-O)-methyltransferase
VVADLSFISLKKILPEIWPRLVPDGLLVALVKPQFEATREEASRGRGVISDGAIRERVRAELCDFISRALEGARIVAQVPSPLRGADGNEETFLGIRKKNPGAP